MNAGKLSAQSELPFNAMKSPNMKSSKRDQGKSRSSTEPYTLPRLPIPERPFGKCEWCPRFFLNKEDQDIHTKECKKASRRCHICKAVVIGTQLAFQNHLKSQHKWVYCEPCSGHHVQGKHTALRSIRCEYCPMRFLANPDREQHVQDRHKLELVQRKNLVIQLDRVSLFKCKICNSMFPNQDELQKHMLNRHTLEEPACGVGVRCPLCQLMFKSNHAFLDHLQEKHPRSTKMCYICSLRFCNQPLFLQHMSKFHSISVEDLEPDHFCKQLSKSMGSKGTHQGNSASEVLVLPDANELNVRDIIDNTDEALDYSNVIIESDLVEEIVPTPPTNTDTNHNFKIQVRAFAIQDHNDSIKDYTNIVQNPFPQPEPNQDQSSNDENEAMDIQDDDDDDEAGTGLDQEDQTRTEHASDLYEVKIFQDEVASNTDEDIVIMDETASNRDNHTEAAPVTEDSNQSPSAAAKGLITCPYCTASRVQFQSKQVFVDHLRDDHPTCIKVCHVCPFRYIHHSNFFNHMQRIHNMSVQDLDPDQFCEVPKKKARAKRKRKQQTNTKTSKKPRKVTVETAQEAHAGDASAEDVPTEDAPTEDAPTEDASAEDASAEDASAGHNNDNNSIRQDHAQVDVQDENIELDPVELIQDDHATNPQDQSEIHDQTDNIQDDPATLGQDDDIQDEHEGSDQDHSDPVSNPEELPSALKDCSSQTFELGHFFPEVKRCSKTTLYCPFCPIRFLHQVHFVAHLYKEHPAPEKAQVKLEKE